MKMTISEIAALAGGRLLSGSPETEVTRFFTDSRMAAPGMMFVPIRGENIDGHVFIPNALSAGAAASFTDHLVDCLPGRALVLVEDCRAALQQVAAAYRGRFTLPIVGITGSVGKTTAKEMIAQGLSAGFQVHRTPGNANSQIGVPITVCGIEPFHTAAVIEMGVSIPGEMARIAKVVRPTCGVITTIGTSHIEFMKTRENIMAEKVHLADYLPDGAPLFVNGDNDLLPTLTGISCQLVTFGLRESCRWRGKDVRERDGYLTFTCVAPDGREQRVNLPVVGEHNVRNALAALAVADYLGQDLGTTARALEGYEPPAMRQRITEHEGVTVIDDSYNASPDSMRAAIDVLAGRPVSGRRIAVLAGMRELGDFSRQGHLETGRYAREHGVDLLLAVGGLAKDIALGYGPEAHTAGSNQEAVTFLEKELAPGDAVLVKGSRGMKTEEIVAGITGR